MNCSDNEWSRNTTNMITNFKALFNHRNSWNFNKSENVSYHGYFHVLCVLSVIKIIVLMQW